MSGRLRKEQREELDHGYLGRRQPARNDGQLTTHAPELGRRLRQAQNVAGVYGTTLARALGSSPPMVARIMTGAALPTVADAAVILGLCGVPLRLSSAIVVPAMRLMQRQPSHSVHERPVVAPRRSAEVALTRTDGCFDTRPTMGP